MNSVKDSLVLVSRQWGHTQRNNSMLHEIFFHSSFKGHDMGDSKLVQGFTQVKVFLSQPSCSRTLEGLLHAKQNEAYEQHKPEGIKCYNLQLADRWNITSLCFSFDQRWCAHYYRGSLGSEKETSPPRDASFLGASGDTGHIKPTQMPLQRQLSWDLCQYNRGSLEVIFSHPKECINTGLWLEHI